MKAIALDVGAGTVDMLLYRNGTSLENSIKMVLPSPPRLYAESVKEATKNEEHVFLHGHTIGGGPLTLAIKKHIEKGYQAFMTPPAAHSIRNNLEEVRSIGVQIVEKAPEGFNGRIIFLDEINLGKYDVFLKEFGDTIADVDYVAISVKDHGAPPEGLSNREFRISKFREMLNKDSSLVGFLLHEDEIPQYFLRMRSSVKASKRYLPETEVFVMDTSPSSVLGCLKDPRVKGKDTILAVNIGNGHTMAALISKEQLLGFFEHHTSSLNMEKLEFLIRRLGDGDLTHEEIYNDGGHGAIILDDAPGFSKIKEIAVTGPRRGMLEGSSIRYIQATPGGDVMMTGTIGILDAILEL